MVMDGNDQNATEIRIDSLIVIRIVKFPFYHKHRTFAIFKKGKNHNPKALLLLADSP